VNAFHLIFEKNGNAEPAQAVSVTASRNAGAPENLRVVLLSTGHFVSYQLLSAGDWRFNVIATVKGSRLSFSIRRGIH